MSRGQGHGLPKAPFLGPREFANMCAINRLKLANEGGSHFTVKVLTIDTQLSHFGVASGESGPGKHSLESCCEVASISQMFLGFQGQHL